MHQGHYTASIRQATDEWCKLDDHAVTSVNLDQVLQEQQVRERERERERERPSAPRATSLNPNPQTPKPCARFYGPAFVLVGAVLEQCSHSPLPERMCSSFAFAAVLAHVLILILPRALFLTRSLPPSLSPSLPFSIPLSLPPSLSLSLPRSLSLARALSCSTGDCVPADIREDKNEAQRGNRPVVKTGRQLRQPCCKHICTSLCPADAAGVFAGRRM